MMIGKLFSKLETKTRIIGAITLMIVMIAVGIIAMRTIFNAQINVAQVNVAQVIADAEQAWQAQGVENYVLQFDYVSAWEFYNATVVVVNEQVGSVHVICQQPLIPMPTCSVPNFAPHELTIDGIFMTLDDALFYATDDTLSLTLDETYNFPTTIRYSNPEVLDGDWNITVNRFDVFDRANDIPVAQQIATESQAERAPTDITSLEFSPIEIALDDNLSTEIDALETLWDAQEIVNYEITLTSDDVASPIVTMHVIVEDNRTREIAMTCDGNTFVAPCWNSISALNGFTVNGLFEQARSLIAVSTPESASLVFDSNYGFPLELLWHDGAIDGEEWGLNVTEFTLN
mgnify:CR=1 FL=1